MGDSKPEEPWTKVASKYAAEAKKKTVEIANKFQTRIKEGYQHIEKKNEEKQKQKLKVAEESTGIDSIPVDELMRKEAMQIIETEPKWNRVKEIFAYDVVLQKPSDEMTWTAQFTLVGLMLGVSLGGIGPAVRTSENFQRANQLTIYTSKHMGKRHYYDSLILSAMRGGTIRGIKVGVFSFIFWSSLFSLEAYRCKSSLTNYILSGALTGTLFRIHFGLKGMVASGSLGAFIGVVAAPLHMLIMSQQNKSAEQRRYSAILEKLKRRKYFQQMEALPTQN